MNGGAQLLTLKRALAAARRALSRGDGQAVFLTGAGVSAESGIPTFRGPEGYWQIGSTNYHPTEMATWGAFQEMPEEVWNWYLYRRGVCGLAAPGAAHLAIARLQLDHPGRVLLITQNVDGLHLAAGSPEEFSYEIHGNISFMRCSEECSSTLHLVPASLELDWPKERRLTPEEFAQLSCPLCASLARPHVLWFDECYDEERFRFESSLAAAARCALLVVVGTTGNTNLPAQIGAEVARRGAPIVAIDTKHNPFTRSVEQSERGLYLEGKSSAYVPAVCQILNEAVSR